MYPKCRTLPKVPIAFGAKAALLRYWMPVLRCGLETYTCAPATTFGRSRLMPERELSAPAVMLNGRPLVTRTIGAICHPLRIRREYRSPRHVLFATIDKLRMCRTSEVQYP